MMKKILIGTAGMIAAATLASAEAGAVPFRAAGLDRGTALVEPVACRVVRSRVVRPNGSVVFRTARECGPGPRFGRRGREGCRMVRARIERPDGSVVFRNTRRCG